MRLGRLSRFDSSCVDRGSRESDPVLSLHFGGVVLHSDVAGAGVLLPAHVQVVSCEQEAHVVSLLRRTFRSSPARTAHVLCGYRFLFIVDVIGREETTTG